MATAVLVGSAAAPAHGAAAPRGGEGVGEGVAEPEGEPLADAEPVGVLLTDGVMLPDAETLLEKLSVGVLDGVLLSEVPIVGEGEGVRVPVGVAVGVPEGLGVLGCEPVFEFVGVPEDVAPREKVGVVEGVGGGVPELEGVLGGEALRVGEGEALLEGVPLGVLGGNITSTSKGAVRIIWPS